MEEKLIQELVQTALSQLAKMGLSDATLKSYRTCAFYPIKKFYGDKENVHYENSLMIEMYHLYLMQHEQGVISKQTLNWRLRGINIINEIYDTGFFDWKVFSSKKKEELPDVYETIMTDFSNTLICCTKRKGIYQSIVRRFLIFMIQSEKENLSSIDEVLLRNFLVEISADRPKSMDDVITALKKFLQYLNEKSFTENRYYSILAAPRSRDRKVKACMDANELAMMMNCVDRNTPGGKRDYAILILAATTGLRAGDIASLRLDCINWKRNEIQFFQGKTSEATILPLPQNTGIAIADYILYSRPKATIDTLFLRNNPPYKGFHDGVSISCIFRKYMKQVNLAHENGDGRTMHGIRRMVGTEMIINGSPIMTVSQVLGHKGMSATKYYIALDVDGLRKCTLGFDSIGGLLR
ncbi:MAG: tyrosine-type recombinase/integrase [Acetobacterium sp.]|nr:tyrosine-type recombinase/integrase [Acetobacterium sp.]